MKQLIGGRVELYGYFSSYIKRGDSLGAILRQRDESSPAVSFVYFAIHRQTTGKIWGVEMTVTPLKTRAGMVAEEGVEPPTLRI